MKIRQKHRYRGICVIAILMILLGMGCKTVDCGCPMAYDQGDQPEQVKKGGEQFLSVDSVSTK